MWQWALAVFIGLPGGPQAQAGFPPPGAKATTLAQTPEQPQRRPEPQPPSLEVEIRADSETHQAGVTIYEGYVDVRAGTMRLQCDKLIYNDTTDQVEALGNVIFDHEGLRISGSRARYDLRTRKGTIWDAQGFTDRTPDGVTVYFEADRIERTGLDRFEVHRGRITSCEEAIPLWSFTAKHIGLTVNKRVSVRSPTLRIKNVPLLWLPYATVPITQRVRHSGFLIPSFGNSNIRGPSLTIPYYQTMGPSADVLPRVELFTQRGIGVGADVRVRTGSTSHINTGFFAMFDRLFGRAGPDQGGTAFYLDAVQYLPAGFLVAADVNITSNLAFRQIFSDNFQQAISPEERTQLYLTNNFRSFSFNLLGQSRDVFLGSAERADLERPGAELGQLVTIRQLPSFELSGRPAKITQRLPIYLSFRSAAEGLSRAEASVQTPSVVQRLDLQPRITIPLPSLAGLAITPSLTLRSTFYSDTLDPTDRLTILGQSLHRTYLELAVDVRPPALERVFHHRDGSRWFKHVIEPLLTYRRLTGIGSDFARLIRFDEHDAVADTHDFELALVNRFFVTRQGPQGEGQQAHEWLTLKLSQQYFLDPSFGGALIPGRRNQFYPIHRLSGFNFGGTMRRFSPVNVTVRLRPLSSLFADVRLDYDTRERAVRNLSLTGGLRTERMSFSHTWYLTRSLRPDQGTFSANLSQSSVFLGNPQRGLFVGLDLIYDFTNRVTNGKLTPGRLVSSTLGFGYAFQCCTFQVQNTTFKVGLRSENRLAFSLTLRGLGSFGRDTDAGRRLFGLQPQ